MDPAVNGSLTLACALEIEERAARKGGAARTACVGIGAELPLPDGRLVSFGLAGGLVPDLEPGTLLTATKVVDADGRTLWEGEPLAVPGARQAVVCSLAAVVNEPEARRALAERTGAHAVDMESGALAATGRLTGVLRAVSDTPDDPVGCLECAGRPDGTTDWRAVAKSFVAEPVKSARTARHGMLALRSLERGAATLTGRNGG